jgi:hypothetical protein
MKPKEVLNVSSTKNKWVESINGFTMIDNSQIKIYIEFLIFKSNQVRSLTPESKTIDFNLGSEY